MFPLRFPYRILHSKAQEGETVFDPFCGRGTTNYAARLVGLETVGFDSSPVAAAIAGAKLVATRSRSVSAALDAALEQIDRPQDVPDSEFWALAYHPRTLRDLCRVREALLRSCDSERRVALRAVILGALHGPNSTATASYLSNQCPRTFAPKPRYAVNFWKTRGLHPREIDIRDLVAIRAARYFDSELSPKTGLIRQVDSRRSASYTRLGAKRFDWTITSPPYYGMRTYIPDQWLRNWFIGGPSSTDYSNRRQLEHRSPEAFSRELRKVWANTAGHSRKGARLVVRFGGIHDRQADPIAVIKESLKRSGWDLVTIVAAGRSSSGKRQVEHFGRGDRSAPIEEFDIWAYRSDRPAHAASAAD
jgi:DNA methylase